MTDTDRGVIGLAAVCSACCLVFWFLIIFAGPPKYCAYLKPVPHHPATLKCSSKP